MKNLKEKTVSEIKFYDKIETTDPIERGKLIDSASRLKTINTLMTEIAGICKQLTNLEK